MKEIELKLEELYLHFLKEAKKFGEVADSTATDIARQYYRGQELANQLAANETRRVLVSIRN